MRVRLTPDRTVADSINIVAVNPRAPATLTGSIASPDSSARFVIEARAASDSSVVGRTERTGPGTFALRVVAGSYRLVARRTSPAPRGARPGKPAAAPVTIPEAVARLEAVITAAPEEELGPYVLSFPPAFAPPPPESQEESR